MDIILKIQNQEIPVHIWSEAEDNFILNENLKKTPILSIASSLNKSEFEINLRIHLLIHRLHVNGLSPNEIRLQTGMTLTDILQIIQVPTANKTLRKKSVFEMLYYSF
jgi:hypothetical protein